ncbi:MAG: zf-HC2 domain-containing protein [Planctomycetota bacterium]|jgi:hypothetical protein
MSVGSSVIRIFTLRCRDATALLSAAQDDSLGRLDRWAVRLHLLVCGPCRRYRRHLRGLRDVARRALDRLEGGADLPGLTLPEDARQRMAGLVEPHDQ